MTIWQALLWYVVIPVTVSAVVASVVWFVLYLHWLLTRGSELRRRYGSPFNSEK